MARMKLRQWRNGPGGKWTTRILWYADSHDSNENIRLQMEDSERKHNFYPRDKEHAEQVWFMFKQGSPTADTQTPFITDLLKILEKS